MTLDTLSPTTPKEDVHQLALNFLKQNSLHLREENFQKPWGGYLRMADEDVNHFIDLFFSERQDLKNSSNQLSPKILIVAPNARLSWQYHHRRAEIWKVVFGPIKVSRNTTDEQVEPTTHQVGELITLKQGERHRLIGAENWGIAAEIWEHTDQSSPSEEEDIVRVQDDYGR